MYCYFRCYRNAKKSEDKLASLEKETETNQNNIEKLEAEFKQVEVDATTVLKNYEQLLVCGSYTLSSLYTRIT